MLRDKGKSGSKNAKLEQELEPARKRARELEIVASRRAHLLNEKEEELALVLGIKSWNRLWPKLARSDSTRLPVRRGRTKTSAPDLFRGPKADGGERGRALDS
jgi:hypothetical protein